MDYRCNILLLLTATTLVAAHPAGAQITFSERSTEAGIVTTAGARGVSVFDFNSDGLDDITFGLDGRRPALFVNRGDGTFDDVSAEYGLELSALQVMPIWVDIDNDDDAELFLGSRFGANRLYVRQPDGSWLDRASEFGLDTTARLGSAAFGDFDSDGYLDLFMAVDQDDDILYRNVGGTAFENVTASASMAGPTHSVAMQATWMDFDRDADIELFAVHDGTAHPSRLHVNQGFLPMYDQAGGRGIADVGAGNSMGIAWGDPDLNGYPDAYVTRIDSAGLFMNRGDGTFVDEAGQRSVWHNGMSWGAAFADFDNDGDEDLFVVSSAFDPTGTLLYENENGHFSEITEAADAKFGTDSFGLATGDFNADGLVDLVFTSRSGSHKLLINETPQAGNWLRVRLDGTAANRLGIGARVEVTAGDRTMTRWLTAGDSFSSQNPPLAHFGLGEADTVESVRVVWGPGSEQTVESPDINSVLTLTQVAAVNSEVDTDHADDVPGRLEITAIYPRPARDRTTLVLNSPAAGEAHVELYDVLGRRIRTWTPALLTSGANQIDLEFGDLPAGLYVIRVAGIEPDGLQTILEEPISLIR